MSTWNFTRESQATATGANTVAGLLAGNQPFAEADTLRSKRNVIATDRGWVRRQIKTTDGRVRVQDEVLVAAHPADGFSYAANTHLGNPDIAQIYLSATDLTSVANGATLNVYVVFNEPVKHSGAAGDLVLTIANTVSGAVLTANASAVNTNTGIVTANNTLVFQTTPVEVGTYKINAQTISNVTATAANLVSLNEGSESANLVVTGAVSNALGSFIVTI